MAKVNPQTMKTQYDGQYDTFRRKNHDYGNSFEESLDQFGIVASIVRMSDKMKRLESLTDESKTQRVGSESLLDTLEDLSNYAAMTACWLKGVREEDGENTVYADNKPVVTYVGERLPMSQFKFLHREHEIVAMLEKVMEFNYKIEWNRMTEDECVELKEIMNRLGNMVTEGTISEKLMLDLINDHVKFNPESTINRLFNQIKESQKNPNEDDEHSENAIYADNKPVVTFTEDNENIDPRNYVLNMLSNIFRVVRMKMEKDEMLVPLDISDEAGLIAKAIVESQTEEEGGAVINNYMCTRKDIPYELKDWVYGVIMRYFYYLKKERNEDGENTIYADNKPVVTYKEDTSKYEPDVTIGNDGELTDAVRDVVTMLKVVFKIHCKIEEFKMTEEDYKELDHITNRLRSMVNDGTISKELMLQLIDKHLVLNKDVLIFQLFNPVRELFNSEFLEKAKSILNDLFENIILCRDQNIPLPKRLAYCSERETKYDDLATLVLSGHVNFSDLAGIVNDYPNLRVAEKNHLLQSIVSAAYKISDEPDNEKPEFLKKKFHIPDEILNDLKESEEKPERKRTVLGMIFPFWL